MFIHESSVAIKIPLHSIDSQCVFLMHKHVRNTFEGIEKNIPRESIGLEFIPSQSELFRFIPISVSEPMRIITNQSEKRFVYSLMKNDQKSIRLNPTNSETSIRMNLNQSETKFAIRINPSSD